MLLFKNNIAAGLALVAMLTTTIASAQDETNPLAEHAAVPAVPADSEISIKQRSGTGNPVAGNEKSQLCQGCHGEFGDSTTPLIPKLAGQYAKYIIKQVRNYQAGTRSHQIMNAMAGTLDSEEDIADIGAYFASRDKMKGNGSTDNPLGKNLFLRGDISKKRLACVNCHGVRGKGLDPKVSMFPVIGGQHKAYIRKQLIDFRSGFRTNSPGGVMNMIAKSLTDAELDALAEYVSTQ